MMSELVSIVTANYNSEKFIPEAIESVLAQTYQNWEMIIVDDCSTDSSVEIINSYVQTDRRIKIVKLNSNVGAATARNAALELSQGRYIAFLDSDDVWYRDKLKKQINFMLGRNAPISFTSYELINEIGASKNHIITSVENLDKSDYLKNTIIGFSTSMIDTDLVGNNFRMINIRTRQDTSLWITLLGEGFVAYGMHEVLVKYREHSNSISANKVKAAKQTWNLYFNIHKLGLMQSIYYFTFYAFNGIKKRVKL
jgi:teichuronic acid biosynthesis glycosyltransferase TuaG